MEKYKYIKAEVLSNARKDKNLTQTELAKLSGVNRMRVISLENELRVWTENNNVRKMIKVLEIDLSKVDIIIK